jgi:pimeloyl-ACP methyl ester carboxylesterase
MKRFLVTLSAITLVAFASQAQAGKMYGGIKAGVNFANVGGSDAPDNTSTKTGFQGGLQWYRCGTSGAFTPELETYSGRSIDVPSCFISGKQDWGTYQRPGVYEAMQSRACTQMIGCHLVDGAGHWVQQEQPAEVSRLLIAFLREARAAE